MHLPICICPICLYWRPLQKSKSRPDTVGLVAFANVGVVSFILSFPLFAAMDRSIIPLQHGIFRVSVELVSFIDPTLILVTQVINMVACVVVATPSGNHIDMLDIPIYVYLIGKGIMVPILDGAFPNAISANRYIAQVVSLRITYHIFSSDVTDGEDISKILVLRGLQSSDLLFPMGVADRAYMTSLLGGLVYLLLFMRCVSYYSGRFWDFRRREMASNRQRNLGQRRLAC